MHPMVQNHQSAILSFPDPNFQTPWINPGLIPVQNGTSPWNPNSTVETAPVQQQPSAHEEDDSSESVDEDVRKCDGNLAHCA
jgi:hypothetical protein